MRTRACPRCCALTHEIRAHGRTFWADVSGQLHTCPDADRAAPWDVKAHKGGKGTATRSRVRTITDPAARERYLEARLGR